MKHKKIVIGISCLFLFAVACTAQATLWEFFDGKLPAIETRGIVAEQAGIVTAADQYRGTYQQNIDLENYLKRGTIVFGAVKPFRPSGYSSTLSSSLAEGGSETTLIVNSITLPDNSALASTSFGDLLILTVGEGDNEEKISVSDLNASTKTFTIAERGLAYGSYTSVTANKHRHLPGERVYISDDDHFINQQYLSVAADETITGLFTYSQLPRVPQTTPTDNSEVASWGVINSVALQGAATSTEAIAGIGELATRIEMASSTYSADDPKLLHSRYATSSPDVRGVNVVVSENDGYINQGWLDLSEDISFTGTTALATSTMFGVQGGFMPSGAITAYATTTAPTGWLACDGSEISSTTFSSLFAVIGYSYGGSPGGDFNLPNLNGRNIIGYGSATTTFDTMGETGGQDTHTQTIAEMPAHNHTLSGTDGTAGSVVGIYEAGASMAVKLKTSGTNAYDLTSGIGNTGSGSAFNVLDPFIVLRYIIKY